MVRRELEAVLERWRRTEVRRRIVLWRIRFAVVTDPVHGGSVVAHTRVLQVLEAVSVLVPCPAPRGTPLSVLLLALSLSLPPTHKHDYIYSLL